MNGYGAGNDGGNDDNDPYGDNDIVTKTTTMLITGITLVSRNSKCQSKWTRQ